MAGTASEANKGEMHSVPVGLEANKERMQPVAGGVSVDEDNAWMQFISDSAWYTSAFG